MTPASKTRPTHLAKDPLVKVGRLVLVAGAEDGSVNHALDALHLLRNREDGDVVLHASGRTSVWSAF